MALALAGWPLAAAPAAVTEPELVAPDPAAAMGVPIRGATDAERAAAFAGIAAVPGCRRAGGGVLRPGRASCGARRGERSTPLRPDADVRDYWLAFLAARRSRDRSSRAAGPIRYLEVGPGTEGHAFEALDLAGADTEEVAAVARDLAARAAAAGWEVAELRAWPDGPGAIAITLRLTERGLLDGRCRLVDDAVRHRASGATRACCASRRPTARCSRAAGRSARRGGFGRNAPYGPPRDVPPPADLDGPTQLDLTVEDPAYGDGPTRRFRFVLDCDGGASDGIADVPATCRRLVGDRYALLLPAPPDVGCPASWAPRA